MKGTSALDMQIDEPHKMSDPAKRPVASIKLINVKTVILDSKTRERQPEIP